MNHLVLQSCPISQIITPPAPLSRANLVFLVMVSMLLKWSVLLSKDKLSACRAKSNGTMSSQLSHSLSPTNRPQKGTPKRSCPDMVSLNNIRRGHQPYLGCWEATINALLETLQSIAQSRVSFHAPLVISHNVQQICGCRNTMLNLSKHSCDEVGGLSWSIINYICKCNI